jgi:organic radical activating enzyme|tara:strand:+ start:2062 stop:3003 length:942 start_codon:yes stop_codon:yes gene_type:complete
MLDKVKHKAKVLAAFIKRNDIFPLSVQLNLTNKCICKCNMCFKRTWPQEEMTMKTFSSLLNYLIVCGTQTIVLSGGEPFLHPKINEICEQIHNSKIKYGIITSGQWSNKLSLQKCTLENAKWIRFSIDSIYPDTYYKIRQAKLDVALSNLNFVAKENKNVRVNITKQTLNYQEIENIVKYFNNINIETKIYNAYGDEPLSQRVCYMKKFSKSTNCYVINFHCIIDPSGNLYPCCHTYHDNEKWNKNIHKQWEYNDIFGYTRDKGIFFSNIRASAMYKTLTSKKAEECKYCNRYDELNIEIEKELMLKEREIFI